jgi:UDP:flavonoid glycosyltransferase YjiC (YdhE family)
MASRDPEGMFKLISESVAQNGQRAVMITGWSGLAITDVPSHMYVIDKAPHDWLFQHVKAVIHHGGAGTTAAGLRWGKPTFIVPHLGDQVYWGRRMSELGVGPKAVYRVDLTSAKLAAGIRTLTTDNRMAERATHIGAAIRSEDGVNAGVHAILTEARRLGVTE